MKNVLAKLEGHWMVRWLVPTSTIAASVLLFLFGISYFGVLYTFGPVGVLLLLTGYFSGWRVLGLVVVLSSILVITAGPYLVVPNVQWSKVSAEPSPLMYHDADDIGPAALRAEFSLDNVLKEKSSELAQVLALAGWVNSRWSHSGSNTPSASDPLTILREAADGMSFRCVEYAIVMTGACQAMGWPARVVGLTTRWVETARSGAGHVVSEVWLDDWQKWVMVDPQFGYLFAKKGIPLHAVELREALAQGPGSVEILSAKGNVGWFEKLRYLLFLGPYLFHFDLQYDQRMFLPEHERVGGRIMLLPDGAPEPDIFQRRWPFSVDRYTSSVDAFYPVPQMIP